MQTDIIELKWSYSEYLENDTFMLLGYKGATENLAYFLEQTINYYSCLHYFINGKDLAQTMNEKANENFIEVVGGYFNRLSFNLRNSAIGYDKHYKWERIILKRLLGYSVSNVETAEIYPFASPSQEDIEHFLQDEILDRIMIYGCGCKDVYCGGVAVSVTIKENFVIWEIQDLQRYVFEKQQYFQAFQEILSYIESKTTNIR